METKIEFKSDDGIVLEGLLHTGTADLSVIITHPHPLYGGDMNNIVVETIQNAYQKKGYTTLRFNFRGVGKSTGRYDDGNGEQADLAAAFNYLKVKGVASIDLAGYSFGTWIIANALENDKIPANDVIMVSPPVAMMRFNATTPIPNLKLVVTGSHDEFAPPDLVKESAQAWKQATPFEIIKGADHFFFGFMKKLAEILKIHI
jgi:uncharacterized protein